MLSTAKTLKGYHLHGKDGDIGQAREFYFDDQYWTIRYLVAETGTWLASRQVLVSPYALGSVDNDTQDIAVALTKKQIENSPSLETDKPVSRQFEDEYYGYYGWPAYWGGPYNWGSSPYIIRDHEARGGLPRGEKAWDPHLRSTHDVIGHHVEAADGEIGHVEDFIIDDETWAIRDLFIKTKNWLPGKHVLIAPEWFDRVSWTESKVFTQLTREAIEESPEYTEESLLNRDYETILYQHYNRKGYWTEEVVTLE